MKDILKGGKDSIYPVTNIIKIGGNKTIPPKLLPTFTKVKREYKYINLNQIIKDDEESKFPVLKKLR